MQSDELGSASPQGMPSEDDAALSAPHHIAEEGWLQHLPQTLGRLLEAFMSQNPKTPCICKKYIW